MTPKIHRALESALTASIDNMEHFKGRTLIAVDVSSSMGFTISKKSDVRCCDIGALMGAMASRLCEDATVCYFDAKSSGSSGLKIAHYGKYDSILDICRNTAFAGGGTDMTLPLLWALDEDRTADLKPFDRVIYFSDNMCNRCMWYGTVQGLVDKYRAKYNHDLWVHGVDMQGYGTQQFCGKNFNIIAGWSDSIFPFIHLAEAGISTLVKTIEEYKVM